MWLGAETFVGWINDDPELVSTATLFLAIVPISIDFMGMLNVAITASTPSAGQCRR
tara:strand:- start:132 stop:299 length:168 start_codon:yes stop_codon:yes gene_type:complete